MPENAPPTMCAARVERLDGPASIELRSDVPVPVPDADEVLVEVHAAGVVFPDVLQSRGAYQSKPELPFTLGSEFAGIVVSAPQGAPVQAGDRVTGLATGGAFSEFARAKVQNVLPLPESVPFAVGAAMPMNLLTAEFALRTRVLAQPGETVLVHGAAGGLGIALIQVAKLLGCRVIAVASTAEKQDIARAVGADHAVPVEGFLDAARALTEGQGVDIVADPVGGDRFTDSLRALRACGRLAVLGFTGGSIPEVRVNRLLLNNLSVVGVGWGAMTREIMGLARTQWDSLLPAILRGELRPPIDRVLPLSDVAGAVDLLERRSVAGKVVLVVREES